MDSQQLHYNTSLENFIDISARSLVFLFRKLHIYDLFEKYAKDNRAKKCIYPIASLLMIALQIVLFRSPSKNDFYQNKKLGKNYRNLGALANIKEGIFPHSKTIDDAFLALDSSSLEPILFDIFKHLHSSKLFNSSLKKNGIYRLAIDATCSRVYHKGSQHPCEACPFCLKRERKTKDGQTKVWYIHMEVVANLIFENGFQMPLYSHRIRKRKQWEYLGDEKLKQECEQTALPFVLERIRSYLPRLKITVLLDGLHANQTTINLLKKFHFSWDIVLKRLKSVQEEIDSISSKVRLLANKRFNLTQTASFTNDIAYAGNIFTAIEFNEHSEKKPSKRFAKVISKDVHYQWIVSEKVDESNVFNKAEESRSRWSQEDFFNTAKNRGFHLEHDYSRHPACQSIWHLLILIAFCLTSIFLLSDLGIKARKTATIRALMKQMLQDLLYFSYEVIFSCPYPKNLRFSLWASAG